MKPQPRPALAVKPASKWRPRGERGLSSCRARFMTLARGFPRRPGLRSRGAGSPLTNVPVSRQQAPARPCHSCLPHRPRESTCGCPFQVKSSGKHQAAPPPPRHPQRLLDPSASSSRGSPGCSQCRTGPRPEMEGTQASLGGWKSRSRLAGSVPPILIPIPSPPPTQRTRLSKGTGAR